MVSTKARILLLGLILAGLAVFFWPTFTSMVAIWWRSETFAHGFLVLPLSGYLIWRKRGELAGVSFRTDLRAILPLWMLGFVWLVAHLADVLVVEQLTVVLMIPVLVWLLFGFTALRVLMFPLVFLVFAVPMGEQLVYPLMKFTATFTVAMLRLTGIPVYWEGTFFSTPSGDWSVVEACSGIRYLIASVFLGALYAYLSYRSFWRRALFIALAAAVPIVANGLRAYIIVMIGHLSDMKLAVGVDHLIYGWVFFGVVMFLLFLIGSRWREPPEPRQESLSATEKPVRHRGDGPRRVGLVVASALVSLAAWPAWAAYLDRPSASGSNLSVQPPVGTGLWEPVTTSFTAWKPRYLGHGKDFQQDYQDGRDLIGMYLALYGDGHGELVSSQNLLVPETDSAWRMPYQTTHRVSVDGIELRVVESQLKSPGQGLLVWRWYWINGHLSSNDYIAKLREVLVLLSGADRREAGIVVYTSLDEGPQRARERLERFLGEMLPGIEAGLRQSFGSGSDPGSQLHNDGS